MQLGVFIGRLQPFHIGHKEVIDRMIMECDSVLILLGSANCERSYRNPWSYKEREEMLRKEYGNEVLIEPLNDYLYDDAAWRADVRLTINKHAGEDKVTIYGHSKQDTDYLNWFGEFRYIEVTTSSTVSGTEVRKSMFLQNTLPEKAQHEAYYMHREETMFRAYPYQETLNFLTADALVVTRDKILLIKRKNYPGKGSWAMPGGFKNRNETIYDCIVRELYEETGIVLADYKYRFANSDMQIYSSPKRAMANGGIPRTTVVFKITLDTEVPVEAKDDAERVEWHPIVDALNTLEMFSDHRDIIIDMLQFYPLLACFNPIYKG